MEHVDGKQLNGFKENEAIACAVTNDMPSRSDPINKQKSDNSRQSNYANRKDNGTRYHSVHRPGDMPQLALSIIEISNCNNL